MSARQLLETVWLVGSGTDQTALTDAHDCHCYLVWDGVGGLLIDAGTGLGARRWLDNIAEVCDLSRLGGLAVTHYHADHAGGAHVARDAGLPVFGHQITADALSVADEVQTQVSKARSLGNYPPAYGLTRTSVTPIADGQHLDAGSSSIRVIGAPGHCDGHLVFLIDRPEGSILFSGDCLFSEGRVSIQAIPDCRLDQYATTVIALAQYGTEVLLAGHGDFVLANAAAGIERAAGAFRRLVPPPNLLS